MRETRARQESVTRYQGSVSNAPITQAAPQHRYHLLAPAPAHAALPTGVTGTTHDVRGARSDNDVTILQDVSFGIHSSQPSAAPAHTCARSSPLPQPHLKATAELAGHCNVSCMRTSRGILRDDCAALASCVPVFKLYSYNIFIIYIYSNSKAKLFAIMLPAGSVCVGAAAAAGGYAHE